MSLDAWIAYRQAAALRRALVKTAEEDAAVSEDPTLAQLAGRYLGGSMVTGGAALGALGSAGLLGRHVALPSAVGMLGRDHAAVRRLASLVNLLSPKNAVPSMISKRLPASVAKYLASRNALPLAASLGGLALMGGGAGLRSLAGSSE